MNIHPVVRRRKILVIASLSWSLVNFRGRLLAEMVRRGHEVLAAAPDHDSEVVATLARMGVRFVPIPMERTSLNIVADLKTLQSLTRLMRSERPDMVLAYTQKPIIYGGIAARIAGVPAFHAMVSGLGYAFSGEGGRKRAVLRLLVAGLYRLALGRARNVFVFNSDDEAEMRRHHMVPAHVPVLQVPGSGVDTGRIEATPPPVAPPTFLLIARLLVNKGLRDYAAAARIVKDRLPGARFHLLGPPDPNPAGLPLSEVRSWEMNGLVHYLGETRNVMPYLAEASVFVLPTWYREGLPRTILEAMASGRAVITTDTPGCRDAVIDGETGLLVPVRDPEALADAMLKLASDPALIRRMGAAGRERAKAVYDVDKVNHMLLSSMKVACLDDEAQPLPAVAGLRAVP